MRKHFFIWTFGICLAAAGFLPAKGQTDQLADRMTAAANDTVPVAAPKETAGRIHTDLLITGRATTETAIANQEFLDQEADEALVSDPVLRIWKEIDSNRDREIPAEQQRINPWSYSTSVGTSFTYFPRFGSVMNMYAAPQLDYAATNRLAFHAGVMVGRTVPVTGIVNEESPLNAGMTNMSTYVAASYRLTENLVVHGSGTRSMALVPVNGELQTMQFNDLSIGATYNFGSFSIGATIHRSDAPFYSSPFGSVNPMYGTPLYW
ncbi:MAG: hypothetical protein P1P82_00860 [Bacteroidales bacterium]|nr:hypothetical protein [Bacteroidales bacterium]MDT8431358.1 hypothetical protein [Bacteroidales bacterium]